jgi:hypothetical protein
MKNIGLCILVAASVVGFSGCSGKSDLVPTVQYAPVGMQHSTNFGGIRKICVDRVLYITSYNGMTPAINPEDGKYILCGVDEYGRVIPLSKVGKIR